MLSVSLYYCGLLSYPGNREHPFSAGQLTAVLVRAGTSVILITAFHQQFSFS